MKTYMNLKKWGGILLLTILPAGAFAQHEVKGKVNDTERKALPYASVRLLKSDSTYVSGMTTDSLGCYRFANVASNEYLLAFSTIGYKPQIIPITVKSTDVMVPTITLESDDVMLGEVVVKGSSFIRKDDRVLVIPDKQQVKHAGTGYDLLYNLMIPGIDVDRIRGTVSTLGGDVTLYIDGRQAEYREVQSLRPQDIERVEYYDVPTGKYANDVASINYITKRYKTGGYISLDGKQSIGYLNGDYNIVAKLAHNNTSYTLFAGHTMNDYDGTRNDNREHFVFTDYEVDRRSSTLENRVKNNSQYVQLNVSNQNKKRTLLGKVSFVRSDAPDNYSRDWLEYSGGYTMSRESYKRTEQSGINPKIELYGYFNLPKKQYIEAKVSGSYSDNDYYYTYDENEYSTMTNTEESMYMLRGDLNYGIQLKHHNSLAILATHYHNTSLSHYRGDNPSRQHLWTGQSLLLVEYSQNFGKKLSFKFAPGLSSLVYKLHGSEAVNQFSPRVRLSLVYRPANKHQIRFNGVVGNNMPVISYLNNAEQNIDSLQVKRGNPQLETSRFGILNAIYNGQFGRFNLQAAVNYEGGNHLTTQDFYIENNKLVKSYRSDVTVHVLTGVLSLSCKITDNLRVKLDGNYFYANMSKGFNDDLSSLSGKAQIDYYWKDFSFSLYGKSKLKETDSELIYVYHPASYGLFASWSHKGWRIEAGTENPFTKHSKWKYVVNRDIYNYTNYETSRTYQQTGYVKVAYTFDFGRKTSRDKNDVDRSINSAIMKVN